MQTRICSDHPFLATCRPAASAVFACLTLATAFALSTFVIVAGWPA